MSLILCFPECIGGSLRILAGTFSISFSEDQLFLCTTIKMVEKRPLQRGTKPEALSTGGNEAAQTYISVE